MSKIEAGTCHGQFNIVDGEPVPFLNKPVAIQTGRPKRRGERDVYCPFAREHLDLWFKEVKCAACEGSDTMCTLDLPGCYQAKPGA